MLEFKRIKKKESFENEDHMIITSSIQIFQYDVMIT